MQNYHIKVKDQPTTERPYEKCEQHGAGQLSDAELLAVIIRSGSRKLRASEVAGQILGCSKEHTGLLGLNYTTMQELMQIEGIGRVKAIQLLCVAELARRMAKAGKNRGVSFKAPDSVAGYYMQDMRCLNREQILLLMLDSKNQLIKDIVLSSGTVNASFSEPREIFLTSLKHGAVSIILLHNHPSGDPTPSREDLMTTRRIQEAGQLIGIPLMDHIIIGDNTYVSLREKGVF